MSNSSSSSPVLKFPKKFLKPIGDFLYDQLKQLENKQTRLTKDDPFDSIDRGNDKASPDTEVTDRFRHESLSAVRTQMDKRLVQLRKALTRIKLGTYGTCEKCGSMIDTDRLTVFPETTLCIPCEKKLEQSH